MRYNRVTHTDIGEFVRNFPKDAFSQTDLSSDSLYFIACSVGEKYGQAEGDIHFPFRAVLIKGKPESFQGTELTEYNTALTDYGDADVALRGGMDFLATEIKHIAPGLEAHLVHESQPYLVLKGSPSVRPRLSLQEGTRLFAELRAQLGLT